MERRLMQLTITAAIICFTLITINSSFAYAEQQKSTPPTKAASKKSEEAVAKASESCDSSYLLLKNIRCMLESESLLNIVNSFANIRNVDSLQSALDMQIERIEEGLADGKPPRKVSAMEALGALAVPLFMNMDKHADYEMPQMIWKTIESKTEDACLIVNDLARCGTGNGLRCLTHMKSYILLALKILPKNLFGLNLQALDPSEERIERLIEGAAMTLPMLIPQKTCLPYTKEIALTYACIEREAYESQEKCLNSEAADIADVEKANKQIRAQLHGGFGFFLGSMWQNPPNAKVCKQYEQVGRCLWKQAISVCLKQHIKPLVPATQYAFVEMFSPRIADGVFAQICGTGAQGASKLAGDAAPSTKPSRAVDKENEVEDEEVTTGSRKTVEETNIKKKAEKKSTEEL